MITNTLKRRHAENYLVTSKF